MNEYNEIDEIAVPMLKQILKKHRPMNRSK